MSLSPSSSQIPALIADLRLAAGLSAEEQRIVHHEAGHATAAVLLGWRFTKVSLPLAALVGIGENMRVGVLPGETDDAAWLRWINSSDGEPYALFVCAGPAAEARYIGRSAEPLWPDLMFSLGCWIDFQGLTAGTLYAAWERASALVAKSWPQVQAIARALLWRGELSFDDVHRIVAT